MSLGSRLGHQAQFLHCPIPCPIQMVGQRGQGQVGCFSLDRCMRRWSVVCMQRTRVALSFVLVVVHWFDRDAEVV